MADVLQEIVTRVEKRGYTFSPASLSALPHDFSKIQKLSVLSADERQRLYDMVLDHVEIQIGLPPLVLHEDSIPNAARELSKKFQTQGMRQFSASAQNVIKDCCPYC